MGLKYILELEDEQLEPLIRQSLLWHLVNNTVDEEPGLREAVEKVIEFYSIPS